jgi:hypothetical protein
MMGILRVVRTWDMYNCVMVKNDINIRNNSRLVFYFTHRRRALHKLSALRVRRLV